VNDDALTDQQQPAEAQTTAPSRLWHDRRFVTYWAGQTLSEFGDRISELAIPLIAITVLDAGPVLVGLLTAAVWAPHIVAVIIGAWVDRRRFKRPLMIRADLIRAAALLTLPLAYAFDALTVVHLFLVTLIVGLGGVLFWTAHPTFFVSLIRRDQFLEANSLINGTRSGASVVGPAAGGALIQLLSAPVALIADAITYLGSALSISRVKIDESPREHEQSEDHLLKHAWLGMRFVFRHPFLGPALGIATTINFFSLAALALQVLYASRLLGLSAATIGLALGIGAVGGLVGAVLASRLTRRLGAGVSVAIGAVLYCLPFALLPLAGGPVWAKAGMLALSEFLGSVGVLIFDINLISIFSAVTPDHMRSRVGGAFSTINFGIRPLGALAGGLGGEYLGMAPTLVIAAVGGSLSVLWLLGSPILRTRSIDELEPVDLPQFSRPPVPRARPESRPGEP
jgi:predicted MFS family arabinose efflux permease